MQLTNSTKWVGVLDPDLEMFDVIVPTQWGTTYNSYLIKAAKPALIDTVKANFCEEFMEGLTKEIDLQELQYLIVNHTEPDHAGCVKPLLEAAPHITVYGTRPAIQFLQQQVNIEFKHVIVKHNDILDLGDRTLRFIMAPFLHWPDTMFTYMEEEQILFSCDGFGCHYCDPKSKIFQSQVGNFTDAVKHYYEYIMSPFKPKVLEAVAKVRELDIKMIATGHGPILDQDPWSIVDLYQQWSSTAAQVADKRVVIGYVSAYGHTKQMAQLIAEGIQERPGVTALLYDLAELSDEEMRVKLNDFDALVIGSPTINGDAVEPIWRGLGHISTITAKGKLAAVFGNFGWSGEAVGLIENRLERMRLALAYPGLKLRFGLTEEDINKCKEFGYSVASALTTDIQNSPVKL